MQNVHSQAFSLLDLVIVMALIAALSGITIPSLTALVERNRLVSVRDQFHAQVKQARAMSIIKKNDFELCGSLDGLKCDDTWEKGWILHSVKADQAITRYQLDDQDQIKWVGATKRIRFHENGTSPLGNGRLLICNRLNKVALQVVINRQGRAREVSGLEHGQRGALGCG